jgi:hypothetical protein
MLARATACFKASTYPNTEHIVFDAAPYAGRTIGYIRNIANACATGELIAHADDDDIFHPRRIEEQVALLLASGKQCVGFRELLFWDTRDACPPDCEEEFGHVEHSAGEAWLYRNPGLGLCAGGTLLYRRELWEQCPFGDHPHEDRRWWSDNPAVSRGYLDASAIPERPLPAMRTRYEQVPGGVVATMEPDPRGTQLGDFSPRFIAQIHGGNTEHIPRSVMQSGGGGVWRRVPEWDAHCQAVMQCA